MVIQLTPQLQARLAEEAGKLGITPEALAIAALQERFPAHTPLASDTAKEQKPSPLVPRDEWERRLFAAAVECGVSPPLEAMTSEGLYD
jgi:hypothetical protein